MQFKDVIGQHKVKEQLLHSLKSGRVSHAQLFAGSTGNGSLALALAYAQYIFCTGNKDTDACGECQSCRQMQKLVHPDLHFVFPVVKAKSSDSTVSDDRLSQWRSQVTASSYFDFPDWNSLLNAKAGSQNTDDSDDDKNTGSNKQAMIYVDESSNIIRKLSLKAFESDYKIMLIWLPERMNEECANKLLKILEEPYEKTLFLMVSEQPNQLLATILSRVQRINVPPIEATEIESELKSRYALPDTQAAEYARMSKGNWHRAIRFLNQTENEAYNYDKFVSIMRLCWSRKMQPVNEWVNDICKRTREEQKTFLSYALRMLRESFIKNFGKKNLNYMTGQEVSFTERFAPFVNEANIIPLSNEFEQAYSDISGNGYAKIIFTDLCIKVMQNIRPTK